MSAQQNLLIVCIAIAFLAALALLLTRNNKLSVQSDLNEYRTCPSCAEMVKSAARICRYCRSTLEESTSAPVSAGTKATLSTGRGIEELITMIERNEEGETFKEYFSGMSTQEVKALLNTPDACDQYAIHLSIKHNRMDLAELFLRAGADPTLRNFWGKTPLNIAEGCQNEVAVALLLKYST